MSQNVSEIRPNSTSSTNLVKWRCFGSEEETLSSDDEFQVNVYLFSFVNAFSAVFGLLSNSLVICGAYNDKNLGKVSKALTMLLAIEGMFSALIIQPFYVTAKLIMLTNISNPSNISYCMLMTIVIYGTKIFAGLSIVTMLGITTERYTAVIYPFEYKTYKRSFLTVLLFLMPALATHFILGDIWTWYKNVTKLLTALFTLIPYVFTVYAYRKIYLKLQELEKMMANHSHGSASTRNNNRKKQSLTSFLVVGTYLICYLPLVIIRSLKLDKDYLLVRLYLLPWCNTLVFCSFSVHALIYGWCSAKRFCLSKQFCVDGEDISNTRVIKLRAPTL